MEIKTIGITLLIISILSGLIFVKVTLDLQKEIKSQITLGPKGECVHEEGAICPHQKLSNLSLPVYLGYTLFLILIMFSIYLIVLKPREVKKNLPKNLTKEEKEIYNFIKDSEGAIFQSELVEKTNFSKVKITRILDKLEGKNLIERKRRGMTNIVILK